MTTTPPLRPAALSNAPSRPATAVPDIAGGHALPALQVAQETSQLRVLAVLSTFVVSALLGLFIARKAYHGYRETRSMPMFWLSVGIVLLTAVPAVLSAVLTTLTALPGYLVVLATNGAEILGLVAIAYSLYGRF